MHRISEPHIVDAFTSTRTSPWPGFGIGTLLSSTVLFPGRNAAFMVVCILSLSSLLLSSLRFRIRLFPIESGLLILRERETIAWPAFPCYGGVITPFTSQRSSQDWLSFQRNTWPLIKRQLRSSFSMVSISCWGKGSLVTPTRLPRMLRGFAENGIGTCPRWTAHLMQTTAGWTPSRCAI